MKKTAMFVCLLVCCMLVASAIVVAKKPPDKPGGKPGGGGNEPGTEYHLASGWYPDVYENKIVWLTNQLMIQDIGLDGIPNTQDDSGPYFVTNDPYDDGVPEIYGNRIVYRKEDKVGYPINWEVTLYDLEVDTDSDGIPNYLDDYDYDETNSDPNMLDTYDINDDEDIWSDEPGGIPNVFDIGYDELFKDTNEDGIFNEGDELIYLGPNGILDTPYDVDIYNGVWTLYNEETANGVDDDNDGLVDEDLCDPAEFRLTYTKKSDGSPAVYENIIAYQEAITKDLIVHDLGIDGIPSSDDTITRVDYPATSFHVNIWGDKVVFTTAPEGQDSDLCIYYLEGDLAGQVVPIDMANNQLLPDIYENKIVYECDRNGKTDVFMYDLGPDGKYNTADDGEESQISSSKKHDRRPRIDSDIIVWFEYQDQARGAHFDPFKDYDNENVYMHNLSSGETYKLTGTNDASYPRVFGKNIVYRDERDGWDVYLYRLN
jgi:beta propeller repeat protein